MIEAVVFDFGHTLVDFALNQELLFTAHKEVCGLVADNLMAAAPQAHARVTEAADQARRCIEESRVRQDLHELDPSAEFSPLFHDLGLEMSESLKHRVICLWHRALRAEIHLPPANARAVQDLGIAGIRLAMVSNIGLSGQLMRELLDDLGLLEPLGAVVLSGEEGIGKPDSRIYQAVLERLGIKARRAVFVGDRTREDVAGPQAVGMRAILTRQFRREQPEPVVGNPDRIIDRLDQLSAAITALSDEVGN